MKSKVIQEFKAEINGITFDNYDIYVEVDYILDDIEHVLNVELPTELIKDFADAYEKIYYSLDGEYLYDFKCDMVRSWDPEIKDIKELRFSLNSFCYKLDSLEYINNKIADWDNTYGKK